MWCSIHVLFISVITFSFLKIAYSQVNIIPGLWFDAGIQFPVSESKSSEHYSSVFSKGLKFLRDGPLQNLMSKSSSTGASSKLFQSQPEVTYQCLNDTEKLISDLTSGQHYALKFLDADGKLPPGFLQGGWNWVGDYQQCNSIVSSYNIYTKHRFKGKYFSIALFRNGGPFLYALPLMIGACLPDTCDKSDTHALAEVAFAPLAEFNMSVGYVTADVKQPYDAAAILTFVISAILGVLILLGTSAELINDRIKTPENKGLLFSSGAKYGAIPTEDTDHTKLLADDTTVQKQYTLSRKDRLIGVLLCFSFIRNTKKLLNTSTAKGPLACLNGLRVISMWWVIQGHTYGFTTTVLSNPLYAENTLPKRFTFQAILNGTFSVDSFFFLSGLLVAYLALREISEKGRLNWVYFFFHRYWRLTPLYAYVLLILLSMSVYMISGPFQWMVTDPHGPWHEIPNSCREYWWSNLLYINNLYPKYGQGECFGWSWYLANDMQFYLFISPLLIILFKFNKVVGAAVSVFLIAACVSIRGFLVSWYGIERFDGPPTKHTDDPWGKDPMYARPWARMSVYVVGFLVGFILQYTRCRLKINKFLVLIGWSLALSTALAVIYGLYYYNSHPGTPMGLVANGFYSSFCRTAWALSLSWLVLACASGYGGPVNWFLSWKIWAPLGRLTYAAYLVHPIVLVVYQTNLMTPLHFTDLTLIYMFVSNLIFSYITAYIVSMVVEAPMMALEKLLLKK